MPGTPDGLSAPGTLRRPNPVKLLGSLWPFFTVPAVVRSARQAASSRSAPGTVSCSMPRQAGGPARDGRSAAPAGASRASAPVTVLAAVMDAATATTDL